MLGLIALHGFSVDTILQFLVVGQVHEEFFEVGVAECVHEFKRSHRTGILSARLHGIALVEKTLFDALEPARRESELARLHELIELGEKKAVLNRLGAVFGVLLHAFEHEFVGIGTGRVLILRGNFLANAVQILVLPVLDFLDELGTALVLTVEHLAAFGSELHLGVCGAADEGLVVGGKFRRGKSCLLLRR